VLILAATPIGNLGDASRRLTDALASAEIIASEDTRTTRRLLAALGIESSARLIPLHEHNEREQADSVVELARGTDVLLLTDAGMPTVSDPGFALVRAAAAADVLVTILPGPSAVLAALAVSGLPTDRFCFEGFLPRKPQARRQALAALRGEPRTIVVFESPNRLPDALADIVTSMGPDRQVVVCRELTKLHEEVVRGRAADVAARFADGARGEICIVIAGADPVASDPETALERVLELVASGARLKDAAGVVAADSGLSARELYQAALASRA
jgi:16S rRNA (cytidine1402-2'-O)-methyltransferase